MVSYIGDYSLDQHDVKRIDNEAYYPYYPSNDELVYLGTQYYVLNKAAKEFPGST